MKQTVSQSGAGVKAEATEIIRFQFQGDWLEGMRTAQGAMFPLRPMCAALGIDVDSQRVKLKKQAWATTVIITAVGEDGKNREMFAIDRRTLLMWLATIDANRVAETVRPKLVAYQKDIAETIDRVFFGPPPAAPGVTAEEVATIFARSLEIVIPTIMAAVDRRVTDLVNAALSRQADNDTHTIGRQRAKTQILARLRDLADKHAITHRVSVRCARGRVEADLRGHLEFYGPGRAWRNLPEARMAKAVAELERMTMDADRTLTAVEAARERQQEMFPKAS